MITDEVSPLEPVFNMLVCGQNRARDHAVDEGTISPQRVETAILLVLEAALSCLAGASRIFGEDGKSRLECRLIESVSDSPQRGGLHISNIRHCISKEPQISADGSLSRVYVKPGTDRILHVHFSEDLSDAENQSLVTNLDAYAVAVSDVLVIDLDNSETEQLPQRLLRMIAQGILSGRVVLGTQTNGEVLLGCLDESDATRRQLLTGELHTKSFISEFFRPCRPGDIEKEMGRIFNPLVVSTPAATHGEISPIEEYFGERQPPSSSLSIAGRTHASLAAFVLGGTGLLKALRYNPNDSWFGMDVTEVLPTAEAERFDLAEPTGIRPRFEWSDRLANRYAGRYRDVTWLLYLLSGLAVFAAVAGAIHLWTGEKSHFWAYVELGSIVLIVGLVALSRRGGWHSRWLFHRSLAEQLRYSRLAYPFMLSWFHGRVDLSGNLGVDLSQRDPIGWLVHRSFVAAGLPASKSGERNSSLVLPHELLSSYAKVILDGQRQYHARTAHQMHIVAHRMHLATTGMFILTTLAVLLHFVLHEKWLLIFTAALPAFAAALHGIKVQLEFDRLSATSHEMADTLQDTLRAIDSLSSSGLDECRKWLRLRGLVLGACVKLASAADRWNDVVRHRKVDLPG